MGTKMNKETYAKLIEEYVVELKSSDMSLLTINHVINIIKDSINIYYPEHKPIKMGCILDVCAIPFPDNDCKGCCYYRDLNE